MENYKEKYECALETIQEILSSGSESIMMSRLKLRLQSVFPELKESEDELTWLKRFIQEEIYYLSIDIRDSEDRVKLKNLQRSIAWLEKQGEQKPILDFKASNWYVSKVDGKIHDMTYNPTDKVEPKFKVGDFIVNDYCMGRVVEITNDAYLLDTEQGIPFSCEHNVHLWTIADAKDGDVVVDKSDGTIGIFQSIGHHPDGGSYNDPSYCFLYCRYDDGFFYADFENGNVINSDDLIPATKEQRDTLMEAMHDAGYEWDAEKKKLKIVDWSKEDDRVKKELIRVFSNREKYLIDQSFGDITVSEALAWLKKQGEQKPIISVAYMVSEYASTPEQGNEGFGKPMNCMVRAYRQGILDTLKKIKQNNVVDEQQNITEENTKSPSDK